jgi:hypothetical protein
MSRRIGLARVEALIENLKRDLALGNATLSGVSTSVETLSTVGSVASPTKTLTAADSGKTFFCDISTVSVVCTLPAPAAGLHYKFVMSVASDNEATKDFLLNTNSDSVDINGSIIVNGAHVEVTSATSAVAIDSNDGAATVGDFLEVECDGTDWYINGSVLTASAINITNAADGFTPA